MSVSEIKPRGTLFKSYYAIVDADLKFSSSAKVDLL